LPLHRTTARPDTESPGLFRIVRSWLH
jgi:hypothetical protein